MRYTLFADNTPVGDVQALQGQSLAQAIWLSGLVPPPPLCSGLGRCGRCRVRLVPPPPPCEADRKILPEDALAQGWRLACRHSVSQVVDGTHVFLPPTTHKARAKCKQPPADAQQLLLAVDLGTTSLCWEAFLPDGTSLAHGQEINPQMGAGADVLSRLSAARTPEGRGRLRDLTLAALRRIIDGLPCPVRTVCLAANTAMTALFCDADIAGLAAAPYSLPVRGHTTHHAPDLPPVYIPPQPAPFVGGDVSAGMAALLRRADVGYPFLLADMGTNGEFVLALDAHRSYIASVPLGPALEGIGLTFGDMAGSGVITEFILQPQGLTATTLDGASPKRICGTGYLSLVQILRRVGVLDADGRFVGASVLSGRTSAAAALSGHSSAAPLSPLGRKLAATLIQSDTGLRLPLPPADAGLCLTAKDVEEILKVKAAFSLAVERLLCVAGLSSAQLARVYIAGALGEHVSSTILEDLGFLPQGCGQRLVAVGNASLKGAREFLLQPESQDALAAWAEACELVDLTHTPDFTNLYLQHMKFK